MALKLDVWNAGHGEAMRIDFGKGFYVIRDFGSHKDAKPTPTYATVEDVINAPIVPGKGAVEAILSHPHYDHFKGFRALYDRKQWGIFERSYFPWLDFRTAQSLGWRTTLAGVYLYAYAGPETRIRLDVENWGTAAPIMASLGKQFYGVAAGHRFQWPTKGRVIWPPPPHSKSDPEDYIADLNVRISAVESVLRSWHQPLAMHTVREVAEEISRVLQSYYDLERDLQTRTLRSSEYHEGNVNRILKAFARAAELRLSRSEPMDRAIAQLDFEYHHGVDDHSVVFEIGNKALFLSDLEAGAMNEMAKRYIPEGSRYRLLKSAHHGTRFGRREFKRHIRGVEMVLHCCGEATSTFHGPIWEYSLLSPKCVVCTDHHPGMEPLPAGFCSCTFTSPHRAFTL